MNKKEMGIENNPTPPINPEAEPAKKILKSMQNEEKKVLGENPIGLPKALSVITEGTKNLVEKDRIEPTTGSEQAESN